MDKRIEEFIEKLLESRRFTLRALAKYYAEDEKLTPIEILFDLALDWRRYFNLRVRKQVIIAPYRVDFVAILLDDDGKKLSKAVIECDGHDFHEKTKEQAENDKRRDRFLMTLGYRVIRFTGREIWRDPVKCVDEVIEILEQSSVRKVAHKK